MPHAPLIVGTRLPFSQCLYLLEFRSMGALNFVGPFVSFFLSFSVPKKRPSIRRPSVEVTFLLPAVKAETGPSHRRAQNAISGLLRRIFFDTQKDFLQHYRHFADCTRRRKQRLVEHLAVGADEDTLRTVRPTSFAAQL